MKLLGAVLAGGRSSRFGSDKAEALLHGRPLIDHAAAALGRICTAVVIVGRTAKGYECIPDRPAGGMGPLGGLAGALFHAKRHGYDLVLSCGVDSVDLPPDLVDLLTPAPAHLDSQPVIGLWPAARAPALDEFLSRHTSHAVRAFGAAVGARQVKLAANPANVNTPQDLARLEQDHGL